MEIKNIFKKTDTVDNVISDFTSVLDRLENISLEQNGKVSKIEAEIVELQNQSERSKQEATRARNIYSKISALFN